MTWFGMKDMLREMGQSQQEIVRQSNARKVRQAKLAAQILQVKAEFTKDWERGVLNLENLSWALAMDEVGLANTAFDELVVQKRLSHAIPIIMAAIANKDFQVHSAQSKRWLPPSMISEEMPLSDLEITRDDFVKYTELQGYSLPRILDGLPAVMEVVSDMVSPMHSGAKTSVQDDKLMEIICKKFRWNPMKLPSYGPKTPGPFSMIRPIAIEMGFTKYTFKHTWERLSDDHNRRIAYAEKPCPSKQVKK